MGRKLIPPLNLDTHKIFHSRDVVFHETIYPFHIPTLYKQFTNMSLPSSSLLFPFSSIPHFIPQHPNPSPSPSPSHSPQNNTPTTLSPGSSQYTFSSQNNTPTTSSSNSNSIHSSPPSNPPSPPPLLRRTARIYKPPTFLNDYIGNNSTSSIYVDHWCNFLLLIIFFSANHVSVTPHRSYFEPKPTRKHPVIPVGFKLWKKKFKHSKTITIGRKLISPMVKGSYLQNGCTRLN